MGMRRTKKYYWNDRHLQVCSGMWEFTPFKVKQTGRQLNTIKQLGFFICLPVQAALNCKPRHSVLPVLLCLEAAVLTANLGC